MFLFMLFLYMEEGSIAALRCKVGKHIFVDLKTTFKMSLPPIFLILYNEFLLISSKTLPIQSQSADNYSIIGVAIFTVLMLKKKFFLSQATAIYFIAKGLDQFPSDRVRIDIAETANENSLITIFAHLAIVCAILFYGLSYVILEKVLKASEVSLWIRGIQLNLFTVPLSLLVSFSNDWINENPHGFFESFNIVAVFFVIFKIALQTMELFVIKVADSIYRCIALSIALVIIAIMKHPFTLTVIAENDPVKLGTGIVFAGVCLYIVMDHFFIHWNSEPEVEYRESPVDFNETLSKGYHTVHTVSSTVSNADGFVNLADEPTS